MGVFILSIEEKKSIEALIKKNKIERDYPIITNCDNFCQQACGSNCTGGCRGVKQN